MCKRTKKDKTEKRFGLCKTLERSALIHLCQKTSHLIQALDCLPVMTPCLAMTNFLSWAFCLAKKSGLMPRKHQNEKIIKDGHASLPGNQEQIQRAFRNSYSYRTRTFAVFVSTNPLFFSFFLHFSMLLSCLNNKNTKQHKPVVDHYLLCCSHTSAILHSWYTYLIKST